MVVVFFGGGEDENQKFCFGYINVELSVDFQEGNEPPVCSVPIGSEL